MYLFDKIALSKAGFAYFSCFITFRIINWSGQSNL